MVKSQIYVPQMKRSYHKSEINTFVDVFNDKLFPVFEDIEKQAAQYTKDYYHKFMEKPGDDSIDFVTIAENALEEGIEIQDIDFVYFNNKDMSFDDEDNVVNKVHKLYNDIPIKIDVKNQARVHLWYEKHFGYAIKSYPSLEAAINTWPTTATALGARRESSGKWIIYSPFGLNDLFGKVVRANKAQITKEIYEKKVLKWSSIWIDLKIIPWEE